VKIMSGTTRFRCVLLLAIIVALACDGAHGNEVWAADAAKTLGPADTGFYLGLLGGSNYLRLEFDERAALPSRGLTWEPWGPCFEMVLGYGFGPGFQAELTLGGSGHTAHPSGAQAGMGRFRLTGCVPLITRGPLRPHLLGGLCGGGAFFHTPGQNDLSYLIIGGEGGAGIRAVLGRHWSLRADYVHSVLDLALELVSNSGGDIDQKNVGRRGRLETIRAGMVYDF
jgi:hypothetical protein